LGTHGVKRKAV